jgi:uncharacterized membrane protein YbhN (UPF0104 family)
MPSNRPQKSKKIDQFKKSKLLNSLIRWGFALVLLVVVIKSGKLSLTDLLWFQERPDKALLFFVMMALAAFLGFVRWWRLLTDLGLKIKLATCVKLGMTGAFFSTVMPGTIGGDLIKGVFIARRFPSFKTRAVTTMIVDRVCGLIAVLLMGSVAFVVGWRQIFALESAEGVLVRSFAILLASIGAVSATGLFVFPWIASRLPKKLPKWTKKIPKHVLLDSFYLSILDFRNEPYALWRAIGLSFVAQALNMIVFWLIAQQIFGSSSWGTMGPAAFVLATVLGICAMQVPVAPMGLGIGQVAFSSIFFAMGAPNANFGSALITSVQVFQLVTNLLGSFFFATYRHEIEDHARPQSG